MVSRTLLAIQNGGINDHVGKGIARYSVDAEWRLPHFEKVNYPLLLEYCNSVSYLPLRFSKDAL